MDKQRYPVSTASFETIRTRDFLYVDKTAYIHSLVDNGVFYFLGRPRRFGKSLLLSTIEAYFLGKKNLFKGLAIEKLHTGEWETYPVLRFDMSKEAFVDLSSLSSLLEGHLRHWEEMYGLTGLGLTSAQRFVNVIREVSRARGKKVVVLVDEYDSPLSAVIGNEKLLEYYREQLHGFYSVLKAMEDYIQFCMLTGVTKFGKVSVFSGLNNLKDISFSDEYAGICGITEKELYENFGVGVRLLADKLGISMDDAFSRLKFNYDGYHFSGEMIDVYNPYSVLNALSDLKISGYWCSSGMPRLLSELLHDRDYDLRSLNGAIVSAMMLDNLSVYKTDPVALFYQTGYLTIKDYDKNTELYTLGFPNREVERGILGDVLSVYIPNGGDVAVPVTFMRESLKKGKPEEFIFQLRSFLSGIPSKLRSRVAKYENYYHTIFYCIASLIGLDINVEYNTSEGFIDILVKTSEYIYIIELKINGNAIDAIRQIEEKHYAMQFEAGSRVIYKIGIGFSKMTNTVDSYEIRSDYSLI